jgi:hypothetical protein
VGGTWGTAARVLVVEDEAAIRESVVEALDDAGFRALGRGDGDGLEELLDGFRPDLVVLDVMLPGRDGFRLLSVVRGRSDAGLVMPPPATASTTGCAGWTPAPTTTSSSRSCSPSWSPGCARCCAAAGGCPPR